MAINLAAENLELLSNLPFRELNAASLGSGAYTVPGLTTLFGTKFKRQPYIQPIPSQKDLVVVGVKVTWREKGKDLSVNLETLVGNQDL